MKDYRHMMRQVTLSDEKKEEIMELLENRSEQKRRRIPKAARFALAAVLVLGCALSIAAGLPGQVYNFVSGGTVAFAGDGSGAVANFDFHGGEGSDPIVLEDGKLWFVGGGERTDLTGLVDGDTPYVYEHTDPASGNKGYVVVGGTAEDFGWAEFFLAEDGSASMQGENYADSYLTIDGVRQPSYTMSEELVDKLNNDPGYAIESVNRPWLDAALDQINELKGLF